MNQILDEIDKVLIPKKTFSKLAFGIAIISLILVSYYIWVFYNKGQMSSEMKASEVGKSFISPIFTRIMGLSTILGFVFSVISFVKKEPSSFMKWLAVIINILLLLILFLPILFVTIKQFNLI